MPGRRGVEKKPVGRRPCAFGRAVFVDFEPCEKFNFAHGLCAGHAKQSRLGRELVPLRKSRPAPKEGYLWCGRCAQYQPDENFGWDTVRAQPKRTCHPCESDNMNRYNEANRER